MDAGVTVSRLIDTQAVAKLLNILKMPSLKALNSYRFDRNVGVLEKSYILTKVIIKRIIGASLNYSDNLERKINSPSFSDKKLI